MFLLTLVKTAAKASVVINSLWRRQGVLVVSALDFRSGGRWFEPGHCRLSCCFLRQETLFHIVSLHPGV